MCDGLPRAPLAVKWLNDRGSCKALVVSGSWLGENMNCKVVAVILGILALALIASADTLTETYNTTDGTSVAIDAGQGETFLCSLDAGAFSCTDTDQFTCYGWGNCAALNATTGWALSGGQPHPVEVADVSTAVPEPNSFMLLLTGLLALVLSLRFRFSFRF